MIPSKYSCWAALILLCTAIACMAADAANTPPPEPIPPSSQRAAVLVKDNRQPSSHKLLPESQLPEGYTLEVVAEPPFVTHPLMGCVDARGRLFVSDAVGVNWNKAQLEANPPNRILLLEDTNHDGVYDKSTIFADKLTFPQGACWLNGSIYVCSPPGLWRFTDNDGDGVADSRELIVSGFDYTGNAADVHGPWLHPNGRLYWCHGRKGHKVIGKEGVVVHEGLASGIWSCLPDGSDVEWHSLGCGDNPVRVDFTPNGDIVGVQNLYYGRPRGDTLVHWLYGGVYEREDQLKAIQGLPRTTERMPVLHNFGHVAVSGCAFSHSSSFFPGDALQLFVTHFNTQRLVRMELKPEGSSYRAVENEFLKLLSPDIHLTDVIEDHDGSLLLLNTGGWFRNGCPSSLLAKPDVMGAVYRVRRTNANPSPLALAKQSPQTPDAPLEAIRSNDPHAKRRACEELARTGTASAETKKALLQLLGENLDAALEHAAIFAAIKTHAINAADLRSLENLPLLRRMLVCVDQGTNDSENVHAELSRFALEYIASDDAALARVALKIFARDPATADPLISGLVPWLKDKAPPTPRIKALKELAASLLHMPNTQSLVSAMLGHDSPLVKNAALEVLAANSAPVMNDSWKRPLEDIWNTSAVSPTLWMDAVKKLNTKHFEGTLEKTAADPKLPLSLRLRALSALKGSALREDTFQLLATNLASAEASNAARIQSASMLASRSLTDAQISALAPQFETVGPIELSELVPVARKCKSAECAKLLARGIAKNPAIASLQESVYRTAFSAQSPEIFESMILPAYQEASKLSESKKRELTPLAQQVHSSGNALKGKQVFESGMGSCIACHQIADKGRAIGPNLSHIGAIRTERDLLESVIFPSNTLARDYETHVLETKDGQSHLGVIKSHTAEGLLLIDLSGQEKNVPHDQIIADTQLPTSLMPSGLDQTISRQDLCDLIAYLRSLQ